MNKEQIDTLTTDGAPERSLVGHDKGFVDLLARAEAAEAEAKDLSLLLAKSEDTVAKLKALLKADEAESLGGSGQTTEMFDRIKGLQPSNPKNLPEIVLTLAKAIDELNSLITPIEDECHYVCPGCHSVDDEPHAPGCPDEALEREADEFSWDADIWDDDEGSMMSSAVRGFERIAGIVGLPDASTDDIVETVRKLWTDRRAGWSIRGTPVTEALSVEDLERRLVDLEYQFRGHDHVPEAHDETLAERVITNIFNMFPMFKKKP
jgi:hypothetical protein